MEGETNERAFTNLYKQEIERQQCILSHINQIAPVQTKQLNMQAVEEYKQQLKESITNVNEPLPKPQSSCICGCINNYHKKIAEGAKQLQIFEEIVATLK